MHMLQYSAVSWRRRYYLRSSISPPLRAACHVPSVTERLFQQALESSVRAARHLRATPAQPMI